MRADYDPQADSIAIELEDVDRADHGIELSEGTVVHLAEGRPVAIDMPDASQRITEKLTEVAVQYTLDLDALEGDGRTALANPNKVVVLKVLAKQLA